VILVNLSNETFVIQNGERIAQLIIAKHERADWIEVQELSETSRGEGGFRYRSKVVLKLKLKFRKV
jgi:dUTP pyrophosphatase